MNRGSTDNRAPFNIRALKLPVFVEDETRLPFIGLALITSALRDAGHTVRQADLNALSRREGYYYNWLKPPCDVLWTHERSMSYIRNGVDAEIDAALAQLLKGQDFSETDFVLLSVGLYDNRSSILALCMGRYIKARWGQAKVVVGGERYPNYEPIHQMLDQLADTDCIDFYIRGYGEEPLLELLGGIPASGNVTDIPGVYCLDDGEHSVREPRCDYKVRLPDYDGLIDDWHTWHAPEHIAREIFRGRKVEGLVLPVKLIHGCPNRCVFCRSSLQSGEYLKHITPTELGEGIERLKSRYDTRYFFFADDVFNISRRFTSDTCAAIKKAGILWSDCVQFKGWTEDLLHEAKEAGAVLLIFGMETASPKLQKYINKNVDLEHAEKILRWSHEAGIFNGIEVIAGLPTETDEDVKATIDFIERNREYLDQVTLNAFYLLRGSVMGTYPERCGIENVRAAVTPEGEEEQRYHPLHTLSFDETGGRSWSSKKEQIIAARDAVNACIIRHNLHEANQDRLHVLFNLYDCCKDKEEVRRRYLQWRQMPGSEPEPEYYDPVWKRHVRSLLARTHMLGFVRAARRRLTSKIRDCSFHG